jgi:hypothetical protein
MDPNLLTGNIRWVAPENLFAIGDMREWYTLQSDMYSFGSIMFHVSPALIFTAVTNTWFQILSGVIPYHQLRHDTHVIVKIAQGETPPRPEEPPINDQHWAFIQRCWSPFEQKFFRPSADEAYNFLQYELGPIRCPIE